MTAIPNINRSLNAFQREAILSASPARLLVMLYDRLLLDLARAETAQVAESWDVARDQLMHAQEIIGELSGSLDLGAWVGAENLLGIYNYAGTAMMNANLFRNVDLTRECIALLEPLRQSWHDAAAQPGPSGVMG
ncbi:flagellar export chaperone FliS [Specibacter sp. RAF43]|uniref:flagellar export chaperone FliS n=1 Tax=Specibacter sp. RAF43 TaxID=3233057 RepID=UPI003F952C48